MKKEINYKSLEVDGIDTRDYPDFVDAFISYGEYEDGTELSEDDLNALTDDRELVYNLTLKRVY